MFNKMNIDAQRHRLLEILTQHRNKVILKKIQSNALGISYETIYAELKCNDSELRIITSELYISEEIGSFDAYGIIGLFAKEHGATAFSNKKYRKRIIENRKERIKFTIQTIIPVLALVIAGLSLSLKLDNLKIQSKSELDNLKLKIIKQEKKVEILEKTINNDSNNYSIPYQKK